MFLREGKGFGSESDLNEELVNSWIRVKDWDQDRGERESVSRCPRPSGVPLAQRYGRGGRTQNKGISENAHSLPGKFVAGVLFSHVRSGFSRTVINRLALRILKSRPSSACPPKIGFSYARQKESLVARRRADAHSDCVDLPVIKRRRILSRRVRPEFGPVLAFAPIAMWIEIARDLRRFWRSIDTAATRF